MAKRVPTVRPRHLRLLTPIPEDPPRRLSTTGKLFVVLVVVVFAALAVW